MYNGEDANGQSESWQDKCVFMLVVRDLRIVGHRAYLHDINLLLGYIHHV